MNNFGFDLSEFVDDKDKCVEILGSYLKQGCLALKLGAGASKSLKLDDWKTLVEKCYKEKFPASAFSHGGNTFELKKISDQIKNAFSSVPEYLSFIKEQLYKGIDFNFEFAKKDLLIALTSLIVGKTRGNVNHIVTYNFDSVLEWYLNLHGLKTKISKKTQLFEESVDVEITHLHGYLPHDPSFGEFSDRIVFTKEEFEDRQIQYSYWKIVMEEFYRRHIFLSIGMSADSLIDDVCPYLRALDTWYSSEKILREQPYGIAFVTPDCNTDQKTNLVKHGIIPCTFEIPEIPTWVFSVSQSASLFK